MRTPVVVIGAGQAGLAMSHHLTGRGIDHVVLDRGEVAQSWRTERWDSLRLLTPNWMTRLPGYRYQGGDPDGFMTKDETVAFLGTYRAHIGAPVHTHVTVERVRVGNPGFEVVTDQGIWTCDAVVAATGASSEPRIPAVAADLPNRIEQLTALQYRNPTQIGNGEVLVVGASASGAQIADELQRAGRQVTVAVGEHVRLPRLHRGRDIHWWMDVIGQLDERYDEVDDITRARRLPSLQLVGSPERRTLDLNSLRDAGVGVVGKLMAVTGRKAQFSGALRSLAANADLKQNRLLARIDEFATEHCLDAELDDSTLPPPTQFDPPPTELELGRFGTVVWATGYRPSYTWLDRVAFDRRDRLVHDGGVCAVPGLYLLGLPFLRRRKSSFIDGVGPDAAELASHLHAHLDHRIAS
ncbi:MAG: NAD(P)-binding domain-containing protein [Ilumatobacteraceae bacterium]|nr:NAD(P)-binding domain-containing protein [Ilumatobacteraceae bacterium]